MKLVKIDKNLSESVINTIQTLIKTYGSDITKGLRLVVMLDNGNIEYVRLIDFYSKDTYTILNRDDIKLDIKEIPKDTDILITKHKDINEPNTTNQWVISSWITLSINFDTWTLKEEEAGMYNNGWMPSNINSAGYILNAGKELSHSELKNLKIVELSDYMPINTNGRTLRIHTDLSKELYGMVKVDKLWTIEENVSYTDIGIIIPLDKEFKPLNYKLCRMVQGKYGIPKMEILIIDNPERLAKLNTFVKMMKDTDVNEDTIILEKFYFLTEEVSLNFDKTTNNLTFEDTNILSDTDMMSVVSRSINNRFRLDNIYPGDDHKLLKVEIVRGISL